MTRQWIREVSVVVADAAGRGIEIGALHCVFQVKHEVQETPKALVLRAFNVAPQTAKVLQAAEFTRVILKVGYRGGPLGTLFEGDIKQARRGRSSGTDTYVDIIAGGSDVAYNHGFISKSLAAGYNQEDVNNAVAAAFAEHQVPKGNVPTFPATQAPRGRVMWGLARAYARELSYNNDTAWTLGDNRYDQVPLKEVIPDEPVLITSATGMIGTPQQTLDGIVVRTLLNPTIKANRLIKLDNKSIQEFQLSVDYKSVQYPAPTNADGLYKVIFADHVGDTRGNEWFTDATCMSADGSAAPTNAVIKAVGFNPS